MAWEIQLNYPNLSGLFLLIHTESVQLSIFPLFCNPNKGFYSVVYEAWTHPDASEFSPCPHKERRQARHNEYTGEASLYHSGVIPGKGPAETLITANFPVRPPATFVPPWLEHNDIAKERAALRCHCQTQCGLRE